jgi:hypothetical protein
LTTRRSSSITSNTTGRVRPVIRREEGNMALRKPTKLIPTVSKPKRGKVVSNQDGQMTAQFEDGTFETTATTPERNWPVGSVIESKIVGRRKKANTAAA